eukprot:751958-Hanusia_phi.AAC.1
MAAVVRGVSRGMAMAIRRGGEAPVPSVALEQHRMYVNALAQRVKTVIHVPARDCCFIEDTAIAVGKKIILTRPGARSRREHFASEFPQGGKSIHAIEVKDDLHLKSLATFAGNDQIAFDDSVGGHHFVREVEKLVGTNHGYGLHRMPVHEAANVLRVGDAILVSKGCELLPEMHRLADMAGVDRQNIVGVENSEFAKADGAITCRSLVLPHLV